MNNKSVAGPAGHWSPSISAPSLEQRIAELEVIYNAAPIGVFLCDRECRFLRINPYLAELNGLSVEQHLGKVAWDMIPALRQTLEPIWRRVLDFGESVHKIEVQGETAKAPGLIRYWEGSYHPIYNEDDEVVAMCGIVDEITDRKAAERHARELLDEMAHRMKNLMAVVCAIAHQLAQTSGSLEQFNGRFAARLQALSGIQDILLRDDWRGAPVRDVILSQLDHCGDLLEHRVVLDGPPVSLCASASQYIGMALHELSTNAMKYGALSNDSGTVTIRWSAGRPEQRDKFRMEWIERGGPPVTEPTRKGYGHRVTTELVARGLDATASEEFGNDGFRWSLVMPGSFLVDGTPGDLAAPLAPLHVRAVAHEGAL